MKYLIIGNGYLGNKFLKHIPESIMCKDMINNYIDAKEIIKYYSPDWVLNCAGATGTPNVDWCEDHKEETFNSNFVLPLNLATVCKVLNIKMLHLGSGCVYEGDNNGMGFSETDKPNFSGSYYSITKAKSEEALKKYDVLQLRLRMPIDSEMGPRNFITKITGYKKVIDIKNSMTVVEDLLQAADILMERNKTGIYNVTNPGAMSHSEILDLYKKYKDPNHTYELISLDELNKMTKAGRSNCILSTNKLEKELKLPTLQSRIEEILGDKNGN